MSALLFALSSVSDSRPEMLPMIVTSNLALGAIRLSRQKVIVKRLNSIQNLGAIDVLCTDKTGTLTQDRVLLIKHLDLNGDEDEGVLEYAYLNSYYQTGLKICLTSQCWSMRISRARDDSPSDSSRPTKFHSILCAGACRSLYTKPSAEKTC